MLLGWLSWSSFAIHSVRSSAPGLLQVNQAGSRPSGHARLHPDGERATAGYTRHELRRPVTGPGVTHSMHESFVLTRRDPKGSADTIIVPALALCLLSKARQKNIQQTTSQTHKSRQNDQTNTKNTQTDTRIVGHRRLWSDFWPWRSKAPAAMRGCASASKIPP